MRDSTDTKLICQRTVMEKHGGMTCDGGRLQRMVEVNEDGIQWAEAAIPPSDSDSE